MTNTSLPVFSKPDGGDDCNPYKWRGARWDEEEDGYDDEYHLHHFLEGVEDNANDDYHVRGVQGGVRDVRPHSGRLHHALFGQYLSTGDEDAYFQSGWWGWNSLSYNYNSDCDDDCVGQSRMMVVSIMIMISFSQKDQIGCKIMINDV